MLKSQFVLILFCLLLINTIKCEMKFISFEQSKLEVDFSQSEEDQTVQIVFKVESSTSITFINMSFQRADGKNIFGGGQGESLLQSPGIQTFTKSITINAWGGDGDYKLDGISFENQKEEVLKLDKLIYIKVKGTRTSPPPKLIKIDYPKAFQTPGDVELIIYVESQSPIYMICRSLENPDKTNLEGGCGGYQGLQNKDKNNIISIKSSFYFPKCYKEGKYKITIHVQNKSLLYSESITFEIDVTSPQCAKGKPLCEIKEFYSNIPDNKMNQSGQIIFTAIIDSTSDLYSFHLSIYSPTGRNIMGGSSGISRYLQEKVKRSYDGKEEKDYYKISAITYLINEWSLRGIYTFKGITFQNEQLVESSSPITKQIIVEYPQAPWIELVLNVDKSEETNWQEEISNSVKDFIKQQDLVGAEYCLADKQQEKTEKRLRVLQNQSSDIQLIIGQLKQEQYQLILQKQSIFSNLSKNYIKEIKIVISDSTINKNTPQSIAPQDDQDMNSFSKQIFPAYILTITLLCLLFT